MGKPEDSHTKAGRRRPEASETLRVPNTLLTFLVQHAPTGAIRRIPRGGTVYRQGEPGTHIFVVTDGRVGISMLRPDGQEFLLDIVGAGALCGEGAAFDGLPRFSSARALEPSEVLTISASRLCELMAKHSELALIVAHTIALKQRTLANRLAQVTQASPELRIKELLAQIPSPENATIRLTHDQIANLIGASRVTVTRAFRRLRKDGTLRCRRGQVQLLALSNAI